MRRFGLFDWLRALAVGAYRPPRRAGSRRNRSEAIWRAARPEPLEARQLLAANPVISEFLARNDGGLRDGDGRSSDWIEIYNAGDTPVDLDGYRLTNDVADLSKWVFPTTNLDPGGYLIVFASGRNTGHDVDADGNLHTNFTLKRGGDYLGLVSPAGTVVSEFGTAGADFPEQLANVSYGIAQSTTLVSAASQAAYLVPTDGDLGLSWTEPDFDPAGHRFTTGPAALGYESRPNDRTNFVGHFQTTLPDRAHGVYARTEFQLGDSSAVTGLTLSLKYDNGLVAYLNGSEVVRANAPDVLAWFSSSASTAPRDSDAIEFVDFDLSDHTAALIDGTNVLALHGLNNFSDDSDMLLVPELIASASDTVAAFGQSSTVGYMPMPTPGEPNVASSEVRVGFVADTKFSVDRGFFDQPFQLEITSATSDAETYFTTDGSPPGPDNPAAARYEGPLAIDTSTTLRAAAFKPNFIPTNVDTQSYIFLEDVVRQDPTPGDAYPATWQTAQYAGDYQMDPEVVARWDDNDPENTDHGIRDTLKALPTISIVLDHDDLWDQQRGIYNHATQTGEAWRRPGSVEYFDPATGDQFQIDAGVQMHGGASRDNLRTKKHSFRLLFRSDFGPTSLGFPLFGDSSLEDINTVVLKSFFTDGFPTRTQQGRYSPLDSQYLRDTWMRDSQLAMGNLSAHSQYAHLYINGLYWGLYSPTERPDEDFLAAYLGGEPEHFDIIKDFNELFAGNKTAWNAMFSLANRGLASDAAYQEIQGNNPDGTPNAELPNYLDVDALIDYMILHLYGGAEDWPHHNWYAGRDREGQTKGFQFFTWDQEIVLDGFFRDRTEVNDTFSPARLYHNLRENAEFRLRFADRLQKHLFADGALTVAASQQRWMDRADQIEMAIIAESARWGDAREGERGEGGKIVPTMTIDPWRAERDNVSDHYLPRAHELTIQRFTADGLYPETAAPVLNQPGGVVSRSFDIELTTAEGVIYFTVDGTDPRRLGGDIASQATRFGEPFAITRDTTIKARVLNDGQWSALADHHFVLASDLPLRVTEINHNPHDANQVPGLDELDVGNNRFEFIELTNVGDQAISLEGVRLARRNVRGNDQGIVFAFAAQTLEARQSIVVARDRDAFQSRYGTTVRLAAGENGDGGGQGEYGGRLSNDGEQITLLAADGSIVQQFSYGVTGPWPVRANGQGSSLQIVDTAASYGDPDNWRSSAEFGGSPGGTNADFSDATVVFNEVLIGSTSTDPDQIELQNLTDLDVDVSGWFLSDTSDNYFQARIPGPTVLPAGSFLVLSQAEVGFDLDGVDSNDVWLVAADSQGKPSHFADYVLFDSAPTGISVGPWPTQDDPWIALASPTMGRSNSGAWVGDVVFTEVHYAPADPDGDRGLNADDFEFIELFNRTDDSVDISGWELTDGVELAFSAGTVIGPGESLIVVNIDATDHRETDVFRFVLGMGGQPALFAGPYRPALSDNRGLIQLRRPRETSATGSDWLPPVVVDQIMYESTAPWPTSAAGLGASLTRTSPDVTGNMPSHWTAEPPSPGRVDIMVRAPGDANDDGRFDQLDIVMALQAGKYMTGQPADWSEGDWTGDGRFDPLDIVKALQAGAYRQ